MAFRMSGGLGHLCAHKLGQENNSARALGLNLE